MPVNLAAQGGEVDGGHALGMAVMIEEVPGGVHVCVSVGGRAASGARGGGLGLGANVLKRDVVAHLVVADGRHGIWALAGGAKKEGDDGKGKERRG